ncbi:hypothetical protein FTO70_09445 [Methanosarcina sp. KYL-1]|uniref:zinc finger HIT domain-containing protein n=1 Tax=Methanosarcina sp. KYL-1 TaxID=2602068 RepID=UPI002100C7C8|nr:zinc finger HIT domain-containing protein [Methanosarcina sp. KYL-1]MCQ1535899.1 hypothetical protein [Methanosarcina sp. KYL-1]
MGVELVEVMGLCAICGRSAKLYTCPLCGKLVCSRCMDPEKGVCIQCARGRGGPAEGTGDVGTYR